jgi:hypothetical protein
VLCRQVADVVDNSRFEKLQQLASDYGDSKGVSTTLQMRALQTSYNATAVRIFVRVFRLLPDQQRLEYPATAGYPPEAADLEDRIMDAIDLAAEVLHADKQA